MPEVNWDLEQTNTINTVDRDSTDVNFFVRKHCDKQGILGSLVGDAREKDCRVTSMQDKSKIEATEGASDRRSKFVAVETDRCQKKVSLPI